MGSLIHELDNDALLMMYLADELSAEDRADVEQLLGVDAGLRAGLVAVRADAATAAGMLEMADRADPPAGVSPSAEAVALRWVGRVLRQRQVEVLANNRPALTPQRQPAFPRWAYPVGSIAAALLVAVGWWGWERHSAVPNNRDQTRLDEGRSVGRDGRMMFGDAFGGDDGSSPGLADAEYEASTLRHDADPAGLPTLFGDATAD